jgi:hypothetical protein
MRARRARLVVSARQLPLLDGVVAVLCARRISVPPRLLRTQQQARRTFMHSSYFACSKSTAARLVRNEISCEGDMHSRSQRLQRCAAPRQPTRTAASHQRIQLDGFVVVRQRLVKLLFLFCMLEVSTHACTRRPAAAPCVPCSTRCLAPSPSARRPWLPSPPSPRLQPPSQSGVSV